MDGGASSPATATPCGKRIRFPAEDLLIESREGCGPLEHNRRRRGRIPLCTTLSQIPLKSFGFPGAESARKRFFLRGGKPPLRKNQRPGATNRNLRFRLVSREATCLPFGQATFPPRRSPASIGSREGSHSLALSRGVFWWGYWFPTKQVVLLKTLFPTTRAWGAPLPYTPSGDGVREGCDPLALSRGLFERCFGFRENARGVPLGTEAGESHIFTSRFRRSFSLQRNAFTALFRQTGCKRCLHPAAPKNGEFMKLID